MAVDRTAWGLAINPRPRLAAPSSRRRRSHDGDRSTAGGRATSTSAIMCPVISEHMNGRGGRRSGRGRRRQREISLHIIAPRLSNSSSLPPYQRRAWQPVLPIIPAATQERQSGFLRRHSHAHCLAHHFLQEGAGAGHIGQARRGVKSPSYRYSSRLGRQGELPGHDLDIHAAVLTVEAVDTFEVAGEARDACLRRETERPAAGPRTRRTTWSSFSSRRIRPACHTNQRYPAWNYLIFPSLKSLNSFRVTRSIASAKSIW